MLKFLKWFFGLFSPYVDPFERKVDKFFKHIKSTDSLAGIKYELLSLMQENLVVTNVWMEKKFKGYKYLDKGARRKMYEDAKKIVAAFQEHSLTHGHTLEEVKKRIEDKSLTFPNGDADKMVHLADIMAFLRPGQYYHYIKTSSFGKLLRDPAHAKLEGDCNQIVTLYIYLFSTKFPLEDLQIKLLPEHVCLHFRGIDIEATNGTFKKYEDDKQILPVTEIISTNLLDLTDFREKVQKISPRVIVKSSQLAYAISSLKPLVAKNLQVAYHNLAVDALANKDFETAIFFADKGGEGELIHSVYQNAAIYYMKQNSFKKARYFADKSGESDLAKTIRYNEGIYYYKKDNIDHALTIFSSLGNEDMKKACYQKQYNKLVKKLSGVKTMADAKRHRSTYNQMLHLAQKIGDSSLERSVRDTLNKI